MEVHVACIQYDLKDIQHPSQFEEQVHQYVGQAMEKEPDIIVFPELITAQLATISTKSSYNAVRELDQYTELYLQLFKELSQSNDVHIIGGTHIVRKEGDFFVNRAYFFYPDGRYQYQDKIHLTPWEKVAWGLETGNKLNIFQTKFGKIAILTCYDIEFPELSRRVVELGAKMIFSPSCTASEQGMYRVIRCAQARAVENQIFVVETGTTGELLKFVDMQYNFTKAGFYSPCDDPFPIGGVISEGTQNQDMVVFGKLNVNAIDQIRVTSYAPLLKDIRKDMYSVQFKNDSG